MLSILNNNELWATHGSLLNDKDEVKYFSDLFKKVISIKFTDTKAREFHLFMFEKQIAQLDEDVYVISFSRSNDNIGLWSSYSEAEGCCIAFDKQKLLKSIQGSFNRPLTDFGDGTVYSITHKDNILIPNNKFNLTIENQNTILGNILCGDISYDEKSILTDLNDSLDTWIKLKHECNSDDNFFIPDFFIENVLDKQYFIKRSGFSNEEEYRILIKIRNRNYGNNYMHFRNKKNIIIPYLRINISGLFQIIPKIILDPMSDFESSKKGLDIYFQSQGINSIEIEKSGLKKRY